MLGVVKLTEETKCKNEFVIHKSFGDFWITYLEGPGNQQ